MNFRCAGIVDDSIVDGKGIRLAVFVQGCSHHCEGCHNPQSWDPKGGFITSTEYIITQYEKNPLLDGITLTGGEPFENCKPMIILARAIHEREGNVWAYSGYTYEELINKNPETVNLLKEIDYLVDGPFILKKKDLSLYFRGSSNQRVFKLKEGKIIGEESLRKSVT